MISTPIPASRRRAASGPSPCRTRLDGITQTDQFYDLLIEPVAAYGRGYDLQNAQRPVGHYWKLLAVPATAWSRPAGFRLGDSAARRGTKTTRRNAASTVGSKSGSPNAEHI